MLFCQLLKGEAQGAGVPQDVLRGVGNTVSSSHV